MTPLGFCQCLRPPRRRRAYIRFLLSPRASWCGTPRRAAISDSRHARGEGLCPRPRTDDHAPCGCMGGASGQAAQARREPLSYRRISLPVPERRPCWFSWPCLPLLYSLRLTSVITRQVLIPISPLAADVDLLVGQVSVRARQVGFLVPVALIVPYVHRVAVVPALLQGAGAVLLDDPVAAQCLIFRPAVLLQIPVADDVARQVLLPRRLVHVAAVGAEPLLVGIVVLV